VAFCWQWRAQDYDCSLLCADHAHRVLEELMAHPDLFFADGLGVYMTTVDETELWLPYQQARRDAHPTTR